MTKRIKYSIPYNGDLDLMRWAIGSGQVYEVYFSGIKGGDFSSPCDHPSVSGQTPAAVPGGDITELIELCAAKGIGRNYLLNKSILFFDSVKEILRYLRKLKSMDGLTSVTVADRAIVPFIRQMLPDVRIQSSVFLHIDSVHKVREAYKMGITEFCLDVSMSRNGPELERIREFRSTRPDIRIKLLANHGCYQYCFYAPRHEDWLSLLELGKKIGKEKTPDALVWHLNYNCLFKSSDIADEIRRPFIRPEDVEFYEKHRLADYIKIAYRTDATPVLKKRMQAYFDRSYEGDLLDIAPSNLGRKSFSVRNKSFPEAFLKKLSYCGLRCDTCAYCSKVAARVVVARSVNRRLRGRK